ncbi:MAG TPA: hypothetical protein VLV76_02490 [Candidatus Acidoferrum sp.]|nr:hypothetical protein [Candidatus Acidoferrum sp.]
MKTYLVMAAAAASILLTSAAFAASSGGGIPHETRRAGDRFTVVTDNEELMCKVAGAHSNGSWGPPTDWTHAITYLRAEGGTRCTPAMINGTVIR